jgi:hypothetical protein
MLFIQEKENIQSLIINTNRIDRGEKNTQQQ